MRRPSGGRAPDPTRAAAPPAAHGPSEALVGATLMALGVVAVSTGAVFARLAEAPPLAKAAWRCAFATALLAVLGGPTMAGALAALERRVVALSALAGVFLAAHFATWIASLEHTSVATSLLLVNTSPIWVALVAPRLTGDRASGRALAGVALALVGAAWLAWRGDGGGATPRGLLGPGLALLGALGATGYLLVGRRVGARVPLVGYLVVCYGTATGTLLLAALATGSPLTGFDRATIGWLLALGFVPQLIGHSACNAALRKLSPLLVALPLLLEPVLGSLLAWVVLNERPPAEAGPAGALVLLGVALAAGLGPRRRAARTPAE